MRWREVNSGCLVVGVGILGWAPLLVLIVQFGPMAWEWLIAHLSTVCAVLAVLTLVYVAIRPPSSGNRRAPPPG